MAELNSTQYFREERANAITHGLGILMGVLGTPLLLYRSMEVDSGWQSFGLLIFGLSMVVLYLSSTLYHSIHRPDWKFRMRKADHIGIYFLIAGTHTPFVFYYLEGATARNYLLILWGLALLGTLYKLFLFGRFERLSVVFYLIMGWMAVPFLPQMLDRMADGCIEWIVIGGLSYTAGVIFFVTDHKPFFHTIWHVFVLAGTAAHFLALYFSIGSGV